MLVITEKIHNFLDNKKLSENQLANLIDYHSGSLNKMIKGQEAFPEHVLRKLAKVFEIPIYEIKGWILADKYSVETFKLAIKAKKIKKDNKLILTTKIDKILKDKKLSRTALSKQINCSQSGLNRVILGKEALSKTVLLKLSNALEVPENEIQSWVLADKYSLKTLETAISETKIQIQIHNK